MPQESLRRPRQEEARPGGGGRQTRSKRQRQLAEDALSSSAALTPSPDAGVTPCPAAVAAPSPDDSPAPDAPPTADVPASPDALPCLDSPPLHNVTAVPPLDTVPSSPPGAVVPATTSTALLSPAAVVAAPLTVSGNEPDTEKVANRQTFRILETCYGNAMDGFRAVEAWSELEGAIMSLVRCHFVKVVPWDTLDVSTREKLSIWAPHAGDYLESAFESHSIFEGWIWRILVDRVFKGHDCEVWEGYGRLVTKLDHMATLPSHLLAPHHAIRMLPGVEGWQEKSSEVIKQLYYNWRPRTVELLQLATGHMERFERGHVVGLIKEELGAFFGQPDGEQAEEEAKQLADDLAGVAALVVHADRCFQASPVQWQFHFADPATGGTSGFAYRGSGSYVGRKTDMAHTMDVHVNQSTNLERAVGRPVDHIVRPLLLSYELSRETCSWDSPFKMCPMIVMVDLYGDENKEGEGEDEDKKEGGGDEQGGDEKGESLGNESEEDSA